MTWHPEVLSSAQRSVIALMGRPVSELGFYLGGGTAIALHLGHRLSEDFDWFSAKSLGDPRVLLAELRRMGVPLEREETARGTLHASALDVKVSLMEFAWEPLAPLERWDETGALVASLADLATMKLEAIASRGSRRDFVDIWALCLQFNPLDKLIGLYRRRFPTANVAHLLVALAYFEDAERSRMPTMLWETDWPGIRAAIQEWVRAYAWSG